MGHTVPTTLFTWDQYSPLLLEGILSLSSVSFSQMAVLNVNLPQEENRGDEGFTSFYTLVNLPYVKISKPKDCCSGPNVVMLLLY